MNTPPKLICILSVVGFTLMPLCKTASAAETAGYVQFVLGKVQATTLDGKTNALKKGDAVNEGDVVSTAASSSAQIKMNDGGFIAVRPDTKMKFEKFVFKGAKKGEERSFFSLFKGGFRAVTGLIGKTNKQNYRITTAAATIGIRGTDHETYYMPEGSALVPAGAYSKVNVGETTITTNRGTINVLPNQMGFSSGMNDLPKIAPINSNVFTVSVAPTKTIKENKTDKPNQADSGKSEGSPQTAKQEEKQETKQEAKAETTTSNGSVAENTSNVATNTNDAPPAPPVNSDTTTPPNNNVAIVNTAPMTTVPDNLTPTLPPIIVPIVLTNAATGTTLNATTQTNSQGGVTTAFIAALAYPANQIALETISGFNYTNNNSSGMIIAPSNMTYVAGGSSASGALQAYIQQNIGGGSNWVSTSTISGGTANSYNAPSFSTTGIQYGSWAGYTGQSYTNTLTLGGNNGGGQTNWMYAQQGYIDSANISTMTGSPTATFSYSLNSYNAPKYQNSGVAGILSSATLTANFNTLIVSASLGLNIGADFWLANMTGSVGSLSGASFNGTSSVINGTSTVSRGSSIITLTSCPTCNGNLNGMFTGQNFTGAILSYNLYDTSTGSTVLGDAALTGSFTPVTGGAVAPTGNIVIECGAGCVTTSLATSVTTASNVLTQYSFGTVTNGSSVTVNCPTCSATLNSSGIYYGTWTSGTYTSTSTFSSAGSTSPAYWITGPEAGPLYLPQALIGTATYALDAGQVSSTVTGNTGTVNGTTTLSVNFSNQTAGVNLNASINDVVGSVHTWNAVASSVPLSGNQGIGGGAFHANTIGGSNSGLLVVTADGATLGGGSIDGQLTGSGLTGAIISYSLNVTSINAGYADIINGVAAFTGTTQNVNTTYQSVLMATYDPSTQVPSLGFYFNNPTHVIQDASGNLTKFDTNYVNSGSGGNVTITNTGSTLSDFGTDPLSGISWGRWSGGNLNVTNRATGAVTTTPLAGSLHWITEPVATSAVTLPISGTYNYVLAGGTKPTDNLGNVGILNSASVSANFTTQTVNVGVNATVNSATLNATATNAPIIQNTVFYASSIEPTSSSSYLTVSCTGTNCSTVNGAPNTTGGTVIGKFTGAGAVGIAMAYGLQNGTSVINGVAALHR